MSNYLYIISFDSPWVEDCESSKAYNFFKIGITSNISQRLLSFSNCIDVNLEALYFSTHASKAELYILNTKFKDFRRNPNRERLFGVSLCSLEDAIEHFFNLNSYSFNKIDTSTISNNLQKCTYNKTLDTDLKFKGKIELVKDPLRIDYSTKSLDLIKICLKTIPTTYWDDLDRWEKLVLYLKSLKVTRSIAIEIALNINNKYSEGHFIKLWDIDLLYSIIRDVKGKDFYDSFTAKYIPAYDEDDVDIFYNGNRGIASICWRYLKDENLIKVIELENGSTGNIYIWDNDIKLWKKKELLGLGNYILKVFFLAFLTSLLAKERKRIESNQYLLIPKKTKMIADKRRYVNTVAGSISIARYCTEFFKVHYSFELNFNTSPFELPLPNKKIINLKTKEVRERVSTDFWTKEAQFNYTSLDSYPNAEKYILSLMNNKKEKANYLSLFLGYCLSGSTAEKIMLICVGDGDNGKTALMSEIMQSVLGSFFSPVADEVIVNGGRIGGANPGLVQLKDRRLACISEINSGSALNEKSIKAILGGDNISARDMYQSSEVIKLQSKLVMLTNVKPTFNYSDRAMKEKLVLLTFEQHFEKDERYIQSLKEDHRDEIGSYLVEKAFEYFQLKEKGEKLKPCLEMEEDKIEFIEEIDTVKSFLDENYKIVPPSQKAYVFQTELYAEYKDYCFNMRVDNYLTQCQFKDYMLNVKGINYFKTKRINKEQVCRPGFNCLQKRLEQEEEESSLSQQDQGDGGLRYLKSFVEEETTTTTTSTTAAA